MGGRPVEVRTVTPDPIWATVALRAFSIVSPSEAALRAAIAPVTTAYAAVADGRQVGTAGVFTTELSVPGGRIAAAAVTMVGVLPTHRRRGAATALLERLLVDARHAGHPVAILESSEAPIYGRFGFGPATWQVACELPRTAAVLPPVVEGETIELVDAPPGPLTELYERLRGVRPGEIARSEALWEALILDPEDWREDPCPRQYVLCRGADGTPSGFAAYRVRPRWDRAVPAGILTVEEIHAATPAAELALWRYLAGVDLVETIAVPSLPSGAPLWWWVEDRRRLAVTALADRLWVRILDVPAALTARRYPTDGAFTLAVEGPAEEDRRTFDLRIEGGEAEVQPSGRAPDVQLDVGALAELYLGAGHTAALAAAGRLIPRDAATLGRLDATFRWPVPAHNSTDF